MPVLYNCKCVGGCTCVICIYRSVWYQLAGSVVGEIACYMPSFAVGLEVQDSHQT